MNQNNHKLVAKQIYVFSNCMCHAASVFALFVTNCPKSENTVAIKYEEKSHQYFEVYWLRKLDGTSCINFDEHGA